MWGDPAGRQLEDKRPSSLRTGLLEREETSTLQLSCLDSGEQRLDSPGFRV